MKEQQNNCPADEDAFDWEKFTREICDDIQKSTNLKYVKDMTQME